MTLVASFVGFKPQEMTVKGTSGPVVMVFSLLGETKTISSMPKTSPPSTSTAPIDGSTEVFTVVEQQPMFPGGVNAMYKFLGDNVRYPEAAIKKHKQGKVFVRFVVNMDGSLGDIQILKGIGYGCDAEAVRVIKAMPKWIPGQQSGRPVAVKYTLPINFQLEEKKTGLKGGGKLNNGTRFSLDGTLAGALEKIDLSNIIATLDNPQPAYPIRIINTNAIGDGRDPLYLLDGKEIKKEAIGTMDPKSIESISVYKEGGTAMFREKYGDKTQYGVVEIKLKKAVKE